MVEIWKDIKDYIGFYQVSNTGKVRSVPRKVFAGINANHMEVYLQGKLLKGAIDHKGYVGVIFSREGKTKRFLVHRLVAEAFIPNPDNLPCVNHKDENPQNNNVTNLEWCSYKYNNEYNGRVNKCKEKISKTLKGRKLNRVLTNEQRQHISEGAKRGWETRRNRIRGKDE